MKIELNIPEIAELNTNIRQLIDTLNDLAVVGINAVKRESCCAPAPALEAAPAPVAEVEPEKPKRTRKAKVEVQEQADNGTGTEVITYTFAEVDLKPTAVEAEPQPEQPPVIEAEPEPVTTYALADCTALAAPLQSSGKLDEAKAWLKEHGADRLKDLDPSYYGDFITFAKGLIG
jgi:hypothetical protein